MQTGYLHLFEAGMKQWDSFERSSTSQARPFPWRPNRTMLCRDCSYPSQVPVDGLEVSLSMEVLVDRCQDRARLGRQAAEITKDIEGLKTRLGGSNLVEKVPAKVMEDVRTSLQAQQDQLETVRKAIADLETSRNVVGIRAGRIMHTNTSFSVCVEVSQSNYRCSPPAKRGVVAF